jgi:hypothetical protein
MISGILKERIEALPAILSIAEAADFFSVRYLTVYRLVRRGALVHPAERPQGVLFKKLQPVVQLELFSA